MILYSIIVFLLFSKFFISNAQEKCKTDYTCRDSSYCGDDMTCFCSEGICKYESGPIISKILNISKNNTNIALSLRGSYGIN